MKNKRPRVLGPCFKSGCRRPATGSHVCATCEKLFVEKMKKKAVADDVLLEETAQKFKDKEIFNVLCCGDHWEEGLRRTKRHAVTAHPVNLLRVVGAGLKGEKI